MKLYEPHPNALRLGHMHTPMVQDLFDKDPKIQQLREGESILQRIAKSEEFRGMGMFLLSDASSYVNGSNVVVDDGHTAWQFTMLYHGRPRMRQMT